VVNQFLIGSIFGPFVPRFAKIFVGRHYVSHLSVPRLEVHSKRLYN